MMHRDVVGAVHRLVDYLRIERKRYLAKCSSRPKDWNASFFSATIRTSMGTNLLVFEDACPVFCPKPVLAFVISDCWWDGLFRDSIAGAAQWLRGLRSSEELIG